jgi:hypothetical protein
VGNTIKTQNPIGEENSRRQVQNSGEKRSTRKFLTSAPVASMSMQKNAATPVPSRSPRLATWKRKKRPLNWSYTRSRSKKAPCSACKDEIRKFNSKTYTNTI